MQRYFFHVHDGTDYIDQDGCLLESLQAARDHAVRYFGEMLKDHSASFWNGQPWTMEVANMAGLTLFRLHFRGADAPALAGSGRGDPDPTG